MSWSTAVGHHGSQVVDRLWVVERMLPGHLADDIGKQVLYYLQSTFSFCDRRVARAFEAFLEDQEMGLFKGPWV